MNDTEREVHRPFGRFRVTAERMPDGRTIRYYEWPDEGGADADGGGPADAAAGEPNGGAGTGRDDGAPS